MTNNENIRFVRRIRQIYLFIGGCRSLSVRFTVATFKTRENQRYGFHLSDRDVFWTSPVRGASATNAGTINLGFLSVLLFLLFMLLPFSTVLVFTIIVRCASLVFAKYI